MTELRTAWLLDAVHAFLRSSHSDEDAGVFSLAGTQQIRGLRPIGPI